MSLVEVAGTTGLVSEEDEEAVSLIFSLTSTKGEKSDLSTSYFRGEAKSPSGRACSTLLSGFLRSKM